MHDRFTWMNAVFINHKAISSVFKLKLGMNNYGSADENGCLQATVKTLNVKQLYAPSGRLKY